MKHSYKYLLFSGCFEADGLVMTQLAAISLDYLLGAIRILAGEDSFLLQTSWLLALLVASLSQTSLVLTEATFGYFHLILHSLPN